MAGINPNLNQVVNEPSLKDLLDMLKKDIGLNIFCHAVGTIRAFDAEKQVAKVELAYQQTYYRVNESTGSYESVNVKYPTLVDCPVIFLGGTVSNITVPVTVGDDALVLFNDRDLDRWYAGQYNMGPPTLRVHNISDGIVIVGLRNKANAISDFQNDRVRITYQDSIISIGVKLKLANATQDLKTILQDLMTALQALTVTCASPGSPSSPPINSATFATISTRIGELLE